jgi:geranylgeranyl reductase family protein
MERLACDVAVVGGGPAGATTALLLRRLGHDVVLLDEARFPRDKICGEALSPGAWRLLESLGVATDIAAAGTYPLAGMRLTAPNGRSFAGRYDSGRTTGFAIRRDRLDAILLRRAREAGVAVEEGARVTALSRDASGAAHGVDVQAGATRRLLRARLVVGADGRRSRVARSLGLLSEAAWPRRFAVRGHWDGVAGLTHFGEMHVGRAGYCGLAPLGPQAANITFVLDQPQMRAAGRDLPSFYLETLRRWPRVRERLERATLTTPPRAIGPLALASRGAWAPGVLLVGDAAGFLDPFTGEGVALALRGATLAAEVGHAYLEGRASLAAYGRLHEALAREKFRFNRLVQWLVAHPAAANLAARTLARLPSLADRLVGIAGDCLPPGPYHAVKSTRMVQEVIAGNPVHR